MKKKFNRFHLFAFIASCSLMLLVLLSILASHWFANEYDPKVMVRKVTQTYTPPPTPPKPTIQPISQNQPPIELNKAGDGPSLDISKLIIKQDFDFVLSPPDLDFEPHDLNLDSAIDWQAFGLGELDSLPVLLTQTTAGFPRSLSDKGITKAKFVLDVFIDEKGNVTLISIKEMPYKELFDFIQELIRSSHFSAPTIDGQAVRARFDWPVEIKENRFDWPVETKEK